MTSSQRLDWIRVHESAAGVPISPSIHISRDVKKFLDSDSITTQVLVLVVLLILVGLSLGPIETRTRKLTHQLHLANANAAPCDKHLQATQLTDTVS